MSKRNFTLIAMIIAFGLPGVYLVLSVPFRNYNPVPGIFGLLLLAIAALFSTRLWNPRP